MRIRKIRSGEKVTKDLFNSESAASTVIAAVLLLSIIFTLFAVVRIAYVPEWKNDAEQLHMSEVQRDMTELKSTADMITLLQSSNSNSSPNDFPLIIPPVTVPISMGGGEIPIVENSKSSGTLSVNTEPCNVTIATEDGKSRPINSGTITYRSNNRQYVDQVFRYENGAVILAQGNRSSMMQFPSLLSINKTHEHNYNVSIQAINILGDPDSVSSDTDTSLRLTGNCYNITPLETTDSFEYIITTQYPDAWKSYFNGNFKEIANKAGLNYSTDFIIYPTNSYSDICIRFLNGSNQNYHNQYRLFISESVVSAEIGTRNGLNYTVGNLPVVDFMYNESNATVPIQFTDQSQNVTGWIWNFGDGTSSTEKNPVHVYSKPGNYTVKLVVSNSNGTISKNILISILKAVPIIKWDNPDNIIYGTPLDSTQLNANASVNGILVYNPIEGTILNASMDQQLQVEFTPTDNTNYSNVSKNVSIKVLQATPEINWSGPADIVYGTALSNTQLNANASIPGTFVYNPVLVS
jgi:PKD repeat protein